MRLRCLEARVVTSICDVNVDQWQMLTAETPFVRHRWLSLTESVGREGRSMRYLCLTYRGELLAAAVAEMVTPSTRSGAFDGILFGRLRETLRRYGITCEPTLLCSAFEGYGSTLMLRQDLSAADREYVLSELVARLRELARAESASLAIEGMEADDPRIEGIADQGLCLSDQLPVARLTLPWRSFEEYLAAMRARSKNVAKDIKRERNRLRKSTIEIRPFRPDAGQCERLVRLAQQTNCKYGAGTFPFRPEFFEHAAAHAGVLFGAFRDEQLLGFSLMLTSSRAAWGTYYGCDYDACMGEPVYFNLVFNEPIAHAIEQGYRAITFGRGLLGLKARRGCAMVPTRLLYQTARPLRQPMLKAALELRNRHLRRKTFASLQTA